jgi:DNA-binding Lrp family transcriptional regulator
MKQIIRLDEKDKIILSLFEQNPEITQSEIAKHLNVSQPSVGVRIHRLRASGFISHVIGVNLKKLNIPLAKVEVTASNTHQLLETFKHCPYFLNGFIVSGKNNLCMFFAGEDISTLEAIVDAHLRRNPHVSSVEFNVVITPVKDFILPLKTHVAKKKTTPCSSECCNCEYYHSERCLGCPLTESYKGALW